VSDKLELTIVVNGQPTQVEANVHEPLGSIIPQALAQTGNAGQPPQNWELRDANGAVLPLDQRIGTFHFAAGTTLFLNLKAGIGG
jgi:Protein of Unknown function (DUF2604)